MATPATFWLASWATVLVNVGGLAAGHRMAEAAAVPGVPGAAWLALRTRKFGLKISATAARATAEMQNSAA